MNKKKMAIVIAIIFAFFFIPYFIVIQLLHLSLPILIAVYLIMIAAIIYLNRFSLYAIQANVLYAGGQQEKARILLEKAVAGKTKSPNAHAYLAIIQLKEGNTKDAFTNLFRALELNDGKNILTEKNVTLTLGTCYWVSGDIDKAIETLEGMRKKYEYVNSSVYTTLAYLYLLNNDLDTSYELTEKAIEDTPDSASAWDNMGQIHYLKGDFIKAKENFEKALSFKDDLPDSLYFMGMICKNEGDMEKAKEYFEKAKNTSISALNTVTVPQIEEELLALS